MSQYQYAHMVACVDTLRYDDAHTHTSGGSWLSSSAMRLVSLSMVLRKGRSMSNKNAASSARVKTNTTTWSINTDLYEKWHKQGKSAHSLVVGFERFLYERYDCG